MNEQLSQGEIERMRQILKSHDAQQTPVKTMDLNNPPHVPYQYRAFPKMVYDHSASKEGHIVSRVVRDEIELKDAISGGWDKNPPTFTEAEAADPLENMTKAALLTLAKERGIKVDPADKKEVILVALRGNVAA